MISDAALDYLLKIRMQFACFVILQFIVWTFFSVIRKRTYANRLFSALLAATLFNLILDMVCVYTAGRPDLVSPGVNHALQVAFVVSSVTILYITYLYVKSITINLSPKWAEAIPLCLSALCATLLPVQQRVTPQGYVSYGGGIGAAYFCATSYFVVCVILLIRFRKTMEPKVRRGIVIALTSLAVVTTVQTLLRQLLISGVGFTVIVIALFYTLESPDAPLIEKLAYERNRANEANRAKSSFLANMSHEIRTPINAILGMDEMILRESSERETLSYASDIRAAGKTLLSLINDILDFSKVEEGKMEILPTQYDLGSVVNDLVNMIRERAEKKGLRFELDLDETTPRLLYGDAIRIRQCALNLLTNAVKYTDKGSVTLAIGYEKADGESVMLKFRVSDTGVGMKPEELERVFSPFVRFGESSAIEGTGLGMSITKQLLDLMGGKLDARSVYGEGSSFSFSVRQPVVRWEPVGKYGTPRGAAAYHSAYRELFHAPDARILVVDDTAMNLAVIRTLLKKTQISIDTVESGREAVRMAAERDYDVIFVDHMMPEMDGVETLRELEKLPGEHRPVYIALTANAISGARELYIEAGFADYLSKPVDGERLEDMLANYLPPEKVTLLSSPAARENGELPTVLVASDDESLRAFVQDTLAESFHTFSCRSGADVLPEAERLCPDAVLLDVQLGETSGVELLQAFKRDTATCDIPIVFLTDEENADLEILGYRNGAADFIRKAYMPDVLLRRVRRIIELNRMQADLQNEVKRQILRAERVSKEMMLALSKAVDAKDHFTNGHSERVAAYAAEIARRMGKSIQEQEQLYEIGLMHDVGKIGVSEDVLNKVGTLTEADFAAIKRHTVIGNDILRSISEMPELAVGARSHHEWYDGSGYPDGLKGSDIPEPARILCVADAYDAMTSTRTYSAVKTQSEVRAEFERCSGMQFDPQIARVMIGMIDEDTDFQMNEQHGGLAVWRNSDQLWRLADSAPAPVAPAPAVSLPDWLYRVDGLDVPLGLKYCASAEAYLETLKIYASTVAANADEAERYHRAGDLKGATVKVHALKSTSKTIGAESLGALAERLESAGNAGDAEAFNAEFDTLLTRYRALGAALAPLLEVPAGTSDEALPPISGERLREAYDAILEFAEAFDFDSVAFTLDSLRGYRVDKGEKARFERLRAAVDNYDWDKISEILR